MSLKSQFDIRKVSPVAVPVGIIPDVEGGASGQRGGACGGCTLLVESDHRIANHFALLAGYVRLKRADMVAGVATAVDPLVMSMIDSIAAQITVMSNLHRSLSRDPFSDIVDISRYLRESCEPFRHGISGAITVTESFRPGCLVRMDQVLPLTQIMVEIITNSLKHAHAGQESGVIAVSCANDPSGALLLEVRDDGVGLPDSFDPAGAGGLGFRIVRALAQKIGAAIAYSSTGRGVVFQLSLPALRTA